MQRWHVGGRREGVEDPALTFKPRARQVGHVDVAGMEDDGVALVQQQPVSGRLAVGVATTGRLERSWPETKIESGAAVVFGPEQDDLGLNVAFQVPLDGR